MHNSVLKIPDLRFLSSGRHPITLQKKIIRAITFSSYLAHTQNLFIQLNTLPFRKLVIHRIAIQMYKYNIGIIPDIIHYFYVTTSDVHSYNTRNRNK